MLSVRKKYFSHAECALKEIPRMLSVRQTYFSHAECVLKSKNVAHIQHAPNISTVDCATPRHVCSTTTCTGTGRVCYAKIYAVHERVCSTAAYPGPRRVFYTAILCCPWTCMLYSTANCSIVQQTVLPLDVSVLQQSDLFYSRLCCPWTSLIDSSLQVLYFQNA
jgi:hypothetical protein